MQAGPANGAYESNGSLVSRLPAEWAQRRVEILGDFYARSKNLSLISTQAGYDGLELAELGYKPQECEENEVRDARNCCICKNLMQGPMCNCAGNAMRNLLQNAMQSRRHNNLFHVAPFPPTSNAGVRAKEVGLFHHFAGRKGRFGNDVNLDYKNVRLGMKRNEFKETYATVEIRQNTWSYRKRKEEYGESSNTARRAICARRPSWRPVDTRRRGLGRGEYEMREKTQVSNYKERSNKKTRFKDDVEIMDDNLLKNENNELQSESGEKYESNATKDDSELHSCHDSDENSENEVPIQRELDEKLKNLYKYILAFERPKDNKYEKPSNIQDKLNTRNFKQDTRILPSERKPSGLKRHLKKGIYRKVEVVLKRPRIKIGEEYLREYMEMKKQMNELMKKMLNVKDEKQEYVETQKESVREVDMTEKENSSNIIPERSHLEIHLQSIYTKDGNTKDMSNKNPPKISDYSRVDEHFPPKVNKKLMNLSDNVCDETDYTKDTHSQDEKDSLYSSISESIESKSTRDVRRFSPIEHAPKLNSRKYVELLRDASGYLKSLPSYSTPSRHVMRRQVKCILRRSPPGTSLRRIDPRRSHPTHTEAHKVRSRSELISHSEHTGHYYTSHDCLFPHKHRSNKKKGTSLPNSASESQSSLYRSLRSRSFSSSVKISRLARGMSFQTLGKSGLENILSPQLEKNSNIEDISFRGHTKRIFSSSVYSRKDDIRWNMSKIKSSDVASNRSKSLVLETFKDVLDFVQDRKPPDTILSAHVIHNKESPYTLKNNRGKINSTGCQVLESFFDLIKYLREIKAASQLHCSRYHKAEHGVTPNSEGETKESSQPPFKFAPSRKHAGVSDKGFLVLEAFREVLKLMKEEEYSEIPDMRCKPTESVFPSKSDKNLLFFELLNGKLFSDPKVHVDNLRNCSSDTSSRYTTSGNDNNNKTEADKLEQSMEPKTARKKSPVRKKSQRKRNRVDPKDCRLRQFFSLPLFDNMKRVIKEGKLMRKKREVLARKSGELKKKGKHKNDVKSVKGHHDTMSENNKFKSKHRTDAHKEFLKEKTENKHKKRSKSKSKVNGISKCKDSKEEIKKTIKEPKEKKTVEPNDMDNISRSRVNLNKPNWRGAADGEACGPSNAKILTRLDGKSKSDSLGESQTTSNNKSLRRTDQFLKSGAEGDEFSCCHCTKSLTEFDEKCKPESTCGESCARNYAKSVTWLGESYKSSNEGGESFTPTKNIFWVDEKFKLIGSGEFSDSNKTLKRLNEKFKLGIGDGKFCNPSDDKTITGIGEKCKSSALGSEFWCPSNAQCLPMLDEKYKSIDAFREACCPTNVKLFTTFEENCKSVPNFGKYFRPSNPDSTTSFAERCEQGPKCPEASVPSNTNIFTKFDDNSSAVGCEFCGPNHALRLPALDEKGKSNSFFRESCGPTNVELFARLAENSKLVAKCGESFGPSNSYTVTRFDEKCKKETEFAESSVSDTKIFTRFDEKSKSGNTHGEFSYPRYAQHLDSLPDRLTSDVINHESCNPSNALTRTDKVFKSGVSGLRSNAKSLTRFDEQFKSKAKIDEFHGRSNAKSLTRFDEKYKSGTAYSGSCVTRDAIKHPETSRLKFDIPTVNARTESRIRTTDPQSPISSKTFNKELQIVKTSQKDLPKDSPPRKMQRNAKALQKMASERYCHLRRRADLQEEQNERK